MAITRKPAFTRSPGEVDIDDLINRGGVPAASAVNRNKPESEEDKVAPVILRLPASMLRSIDSAVKSRPVRIPRHTWLLEAIYEKLSRDSSAAESE